MKLIDKDAVMAEIERRKRQNLLNEGAFEEDIDILSFLDSLEVKEVQEEPVSEELEKVVEEIVEPTVLNAYGVKDIANRLRRTMIEPVSKELEEASKEWLRQKLDKSYANYGETKMMELTHFDGYAMLDAIEFGAKWGRNQAMAEIQAQSMALAHGCPKESVCSLLA